MHSEGPLQSDNPALDAWQQPQRQNQCQRQPYGEMDHEGWLPNLLYNQEERHDDVSDDEYRKIGRGVVGSLVVQFAGTNRTSRIDFEITGIERSLATGGATFPEAPQ